MKSYNWDMKAGSRVMPKKDEEVSELLLFAPDYTPSEDKFFYLMKDLEEF